MKKHFLLSLLITLSSQAFGQEAIKKYVQANAVPIQSIEASYADDTDLEEIGKAIGDARIVMLGEQDHGDGAAMQAKSRLVKYLHEKKGFTVLAFEGDYFGLTEGWEHVEKDEPNIKRLLQQNLHGVWPFCQQCSDLFYDYIPATHQTDNPLQIAGFDNQLIYKYTIDSLSTRIDRYLQVQNIPYLQDETYASFFKPTVHALTKPQLRKPLIGNKQTLMRFHDTAEKVLSQLDKAERTSLDYMLIKNLKEHAKQLSIEEYHPSAVVRDRQMADNLRWLADVKYPDAKIIVWAANVHIMKNANTALKHKQYAHDWMGTVFTSDSLRNAQTYVLGFSSKYGAYKRVAQPKSSPVLKPLKNSFETWMDDKHAYAFIDFRRFRKENPSFSKHFPMKGHGQQHDIGIWTEMYDGIFYIRNMTPCDDLSVQ